MGPMLTAFGKFISVAAPIAAKRGGGSRSNLHVLDLLKGGFAAGTLDVKTAAARVRELRSGIPDKKGRVRTAAAAGVLERAEKMVLEEAKKQGMSPQDIVALEHSMSHASAAGLRGNSVSARFSSARQQRTFRDPPRTGAAAGAASPPPEDDFVGDPYFVGPRQPGVGGGGGGQRPPPPPGGGGDDSVGPMPPGADDAAGAAAGAASGLAGLRQGLGARADSLYHRAVGSMPAKTVLGGAGLGAGMAVVSGEDPLAGAVEGGASAGAGYGGYWLANKALNWTPKPFRIGASALAGMYASTLPGELNLGAQQRDPVRVVPPPVGSPLAARASAAARDFLLQNNPELRDSATLERQVAMLANTILDQVQRARINPEQLNHVDLVSLAQEAFVEQ